MNRPSVLIFSGADPSSGAGMQADVQAVSALGAHPLSVITALTVQDNDRVYTINAVSTALLQKQAQALINKITISAVKIGIVGNHGNAAAIAHIIQKLRQRQPDLPVVFDPVLASGQGDALGEDNILQALQPLMSVATLITPNLMEAAKLTAGERRADTQAELLLQQGCQHVLIKGGHGTDEKVLNRWFTDGDARDWSWPRLTGEFHGSGCTLASAIAALLACGKSMAEALERAQAYTHAALETSYSIADGQRIPNRTRPFFKEEK